MISRACRGEKANGSAPPPVRAAAFLLSAGAVCRAPLEAPFASKGETARTFEIIQAASCRSERYGLSLRSRHPERSGVAAQSKDLYEK